MFNKRLQIFSFFGIKIGIDLSWILIAILLTWTLASGFFPYHYPHLSSSGYLSLGLVGMLALFVCVILHELGHALVAKHYQLPISQITLFLFGGVAEIKKEPESPKVEFLMAIAGPLVSLAIALLMYAGMQLTKHFDWPIYIQAITHYLTYVNGAIAIFNLIPAFPLDGGRILRSLLWAWKKNLALATKISTKAGSAFGLFLIFLGIFSFISGNFLSGIWLAILGLFLQRAASSSQNRFYIERDLKSKRVALFMKTDPIKVAPDISIRTFADEFLYPSHHYLYPVVEGQKALGYISLMEIKAVPSSEWENIKVRALMIPLDQCITLNPTTDALKALDLFQQSNTPTLLVIENTKLVGILSVVDVLQSLSLKWELESKW